MSDAINRRFIDRVVLVAGAGSGIGREASLRFAAEGAAVGCADLRADAAQTAADLVAAKGGRALALPLDVRDAGQWQTAVDRLLASFGRWDVLVNSAGVAAAGLVADMELADWRRVLETNLDGAFLATKYALRAMQSRGGSIVHVSSASGVKAAAGAGAYSTSKAALNMLVSVAAKECRDANLPIRINAVSPAGVKTPMWTSMAFFRDLVEKSGSEDAAFDVVAGGSPGGKFAEPGDVVDAILFLASDASRFVTGANLIMDGGYTL